MWVLFSDPHILITTATPSRLHVDAPGVKKKGKQGSRILVRRIYSGGGLCGCFVCGIWMRARSGFEETTFFSNLRKFKFPFSSQFIHCSWFPAIPFASCV